MKYKNLKIILVLMFFYIQVIIANVSYLPAYDQILEKTGFTIAYSEKHEQPRWVAYKVTKENFIGSTKREDYTFKEDTAVKTGSATSQDYKNSGYVRGHIAPAAIMVWSNYAMAESFLFSNISPQAQSFNNGIWKKLENVIRKWALNNDSIFVISGPVLKETLNRIGPNNVSIPEHFFKVVLKFCPDEKKAIGFLIPHIKTNDPIEKFAVTIDKIEEITGIDFFESMDDTLENRIEGTFDYYTW